MARIRSIHPGQWTDEDFVEMSFGARLLAIAIRNECDDKGVFAWKPRTIKMNLFPADNLDMEPLLAELVDAHIVTSYEVGARQYGAVRNFRTFQRPKKPNDVYPLPTELRTFVGISEADREAFPNHFRTCSEIRPQMEKEKEKEGSKSQSKRRRRFRGEVKVGEGAEA